MVFLRFENRINGNQKVIYHDPLARSLYLLKRRAEYNFKKFNYWVTLTFANSECVYDKEGNEYLFKSSIKEFKGSGSVMRRFVNKVQTYYRRREKKFTYLWKYEEGRKNNRPHFHLLCWDFRGLEKFRKYLKRTWDYGFIAVEKISRKRELNDYLNKYFTKGSNLKFWIMKKRKKKWGCSRNVRNPLPEPTDYEFVDMVNWSIAVETVYGSRKGLLEEMGPVRFRYYLRYVSRSARVDYRIIKRFRKENTSWFLRKSVIPKTVHV